MPLVISNSEYNSIHSWLKKNYGKADKCENEECTSVVFGESKIYYHWCLKEGFGYEKKRENFIELCVRCHVNYDRKYGLINLYEKPRQIYVDGATWLLIKAEMERTGKKSRQILAEAVDKQLLNKK